MVVYRHDNYPIYINSLPADIYSGTNNNLHYNISSNGTSLKLLFSVNSVSTCRFGLNSVYLNVPLIGSYNVIQSPAVSGFIVDSKNISHSITANYPTGDSVFFSSDVLCLNNLHSNLKSQITSYDSIQANELLYLPLLHVIPQEFIDPSSDTTYNTNTRVGIISGDYGIIGDNNELNVFNNETIVNENTNVFYNPVTDTSYNFTAWSYDYSDRSYTLILDTGDTVNIEYGDETLNIKQGDTTYNLYYITNIPTSDPDPSPSPSTSPDDPSPSPGSGGSGSDVDYTSIINSIADKIDLLISRVGNIDNDTNDIDFIINNLDVRSENSFLYLKLIHDSLQMIQADVATTKDRTTDILAVARNVYAQGELTNEALVEMQDTLNDILSESQVISDKLDVINGNLEDDEGVSWLRRIYYSILSLGGNNNDPVEVDTDDEDDEEINTLDFINQIKDRFMWVFDLGDVFNQLVADVTSDANSASAISSGTLEQSSLSSGHAETALTASSGLQTSSATAPELMLRLGASDKYGVDWENISVIDLSWYASWKEMVDDLLSGFLWLGYVWLLIKRVPSIINGGAMVTEDAISISNYGNRSGGN